jgi:hypothetical protein
MDALSELLEQLKEGEQTQGNLLGFLHVFIGRTVTLSKDGTVISRGLSWRDLAARLKKIRWDPEAVRELGLNPDDLPPRDRQRYWYSAIAQARVDSPKATEAGDRFAEILRTLGYDVGPAPHG